MTDTINQQVNGSLAVLDFLDSLAILISHAESSVTDHSLFDIDTIDQLSYSFDQLFEYSQRFDFEVPQGLLDRVLSLYLNLAKSISIPFEARVGILQDCIWIAEQFLNLFSNPVRTQDSELLSIFHKLQCARVSLVGLACHWLQAHYRERDIFVLLNNAIDELERQVELDSKDVESVGLLIWALNLSIRYGQVSDETESSRLRPAQERCVNLAHGLLDSIDKPDYPHSALAKGHAILALSEYEYRTENFEKARELLDSTLEIEPAALEVLAMAVEVAANHSDFEHAFNLLTFLPPVSTDYQRALAFLETLQLDHSPELQSLISETKRICSSISSIRDRLFNLLHFQGGFSFRLACEGSVVIELSQTYTVDKIVSLFFDISEGVVRSIQRSIFCLINPHLWVFAESGNEIPVGTRISICSLADGCKLQLYEVDLQILLLGFIGSRNSESGANLNSLVASRIEQLIATLAERRERLARYQDIIEFASATAAIETQLLDQAHSSEALDAGAKDSLVKSIDSILKSNASLSNYTKLFELEGEFLLIHARAIQLTRWQERSEAHTNSAEVCEAVLDQLRGLLHHTELSKKSLKLVIYLLAEVSAFRISTIVQSCGRANRSDQDLELNKLRGIAGLEAEQKSAQMSISQIHATLDSLEDDISLLGIDGVLSSDDSASLTRALNVYRWKQIAQVNYFSNLQDQVRVSLQSMLSRAIGITQSQLEPHEKRKVERIDDKLNWNGPIYEGAKLLSLGETQLAKICQSFFAIEKSGQILAMQSLLDVVAWMLKHGSMQDRVVISELYQGVRREAAKRISSTTGENTLELRKVFAILEVINLYFDAFYEDMESLLNHSEVAMGFARLVDSSGEITNFEPIALFGVVGALRYLAQSTKDSKTRILALTQIRKLRAEFELSQVSNSDSGMDREYLALLYLVEALSYAEFGERKDLNRTIDQLASLPRLHSQSRIVTCLREVAVANVGQTNFTETLNRATATLFSDKSLIGELIEERGDSAYLINIFSEYNQSVLKYVNNQIPLFGIISPNLLIGDISERIINARLSCSESVFRENEDVGAPNFDLTIYDPSLRPTQVGLFEKVGSGQEIEQSEKLRINPRTRISTKPIGETLVSEVLKFESKVIKFFAKALFRNDDELGIELDIEPGVAVLMLLVLAGNYEPETQVELLNIIVRQSADTILLSRLYRDAELTFLAVGQDPLAAVKKLENSLKCVELRLFTAEEMVRFSETLFGDDYGRQLRISIREKSISIDDIRAAVISSSNSIGERVKDETEEFSSDDDSGDDYFDSIDDYDELDDLFDNQSDKQVAEKRIKPIGTEKPITNPISATDGGGSSSDDGEWERLIDEIFRDDEDESLEGDDISGEGVDEPTFDSDSAEKYITRGFPGTDAQSRADDPKPKKESEKPTDSPSKLSSWFKE